MVLMALSPTYIVTNYSNELLLILVKTQHYH